MFCVLLQVIDEYCFLVRIDDWTSDSESHKINICCHGDSKCIYPVNWCLYKGLRIRPPKGEYRTVYIEITVGHDQLTVVVVSSVCPPKKERSSIPELSRF